MTRTYSRTPQDQTSAFCRWCGSKAGAVGIEGHAGGWQPGCSRWDSHGGMLAAAPPLYLPVHRQLLPHLPVVDLPRLVCDHLWRQVGGGAHPAGGRAVLVGILAETKVSQLQRQQRRCRREVACAQAVSMPHTHTSVHASCMQRTQDQMLFASSPAEWAHLDQRPRAAIQQRVLQLDVTVGDTLHRKQDASRQ